MKTKRCVACDRRLSPAHGNRAYCSDECRQRPAPAVYRFVCPDGRCYVGSVGNSRYRSKHGFNRSNPWLAEAFAKHPIETWTYEVLETLPPACPVQSMRFAEQRYIERFRSWLPEHGFNIRPAVWKGDTPGILAARARHAEQVRQSALAVSERNRAR